MGVLEILAQIDQEIAQLKQARAHRGGGAEESSGRTVTESADGPWSGRFENQPMTRSCTMP
ncbi:MAG: hypothetical protein ABR924_09700 [Terracidiphilus sp.]